MDIRIIIPCYNEPGIISTIESLFSCESGQIQAEIIVIINSYQISTEKIKQFNRETFNLLSDLSQKNNVQHLSLKPFLIEEIPGHQTGAGLPRKIGMDKAAESFESEGNSTGIIVSLDADCTVDKNYLTEIYHSFKKNKLKSAIIEFHHPVEHLDPKDKIRRATEIYEEYLRYYKDALEYIGYPYAYYTIGSAFAVTVKTYIQVGGMGKQQAGEDFYFLQKVFPLGKTKFITSTCVYPAARISDRVPFGTGPSIAKLIESDTIIKLSYQFVAFEELKVFFNDIDSFFKLSIDKIAEKCREYPIYLQSFLKEDNFLSKIEEINLHTSNTKTFMKRFFNYFTAFKILKYLNYIHPDPYILKEVSQEYKILKNHLSQS